MKKTILPLLLFAATGFAQVQLGGHAYVPSTQDSLLGRTAVVFTADANCTLATATNCTVSNGVSGPYTGVLVVTGTISATRNVIVPLSQQYTVDNQTTGGQSIQLIGASGTGVTVANGATVPVIFDGTNYVQAGGAGTLTGVTPTSPITGGGTSGNVTVGCTTCATLPASQTFTGNNTFTGQTAFNATSTISNAVGITQTVSNSGTASLNVAQTVSGGIATTGAINLSVSGAGNGSNPALNIAMSNTGGHEGGTGVAAIITGKSDSLDGALVQITNSVNNGPALSVASTGGGVGLSADTIRTTSVTSASSLATDSTGKIIAGSVSSGVNPLGSSITAEWPLTENGATVTCGTGSSYAACDISGNGNNASNCTGSVNAPTWKPYGIKINDGSTSSQCLLTPIKTYRTVYLYACETPGFLPNSFSSTSPGFGQAYALWGPTTTTDGTGIVSSISAAGYSIGIQPATNYFPAGGSVYGASANAIYSGCHVYAAVLNTTGGDAMYVDGALQASSTSGNNGANATTTGNYLIGCTVGCLGQHYWQGAIGYVVVEGTTAETAENVALETRYIQQKVAGRETTLSYYGQSLTTYPQNTIIADGDSRTCQFEGSGAQWYALMTLTNTYTITATCLAGTHAYDAPSAAQIRVPQYISPYGKNYIVAWKDVNDWSAGQTVAQVEASEWNYWNTLKHGLATPSTVPSQNAPVPSITVICSTGTSATGDDTNQALLNTWIRQNWNAPGSGCDMLSDLGENPNLSPNGSNYNSSTYYNSDHLHFTGTGGNCTTATGYGIECVARQTAINLLDGSSAASPQVLSATGNIGLNRFTVYSGSGAGTLTLPDCSYMTGQIFTVSNATASYTVTMATTSSQINSGAATVAPGAVARFLDQLTSNTAGGCGWVAN